MNILIIGDGSAGKRHAQHLTARGHECCIAGPANRYSVTLFQACVIASPPEWHTEHLGLVRRLADMHILCEGPMTLEPNLHSTSVRMMASNWRFVDDLQTTRDYVRDKKPVNAHFWFDYDLMHWRPGMDMTKTCYYHSGHDLINVHEVDMALWFFGPADRVHVERIYTGKSKACDGFSMLIKHKTGVLSTISSSWHSDSYDRGYNIVFTNGVNLSKRWDSPADDPVVNESYAALIDHWLKAIEEGDTNVEPSFMDGYRAYQALQGVAI